MSSECSGTTCTAVAPARQQLTHSADAPVIVARASTLELESFLFPELYRSPHVSLATQTSTQALCLRLSQPAVRKLEHLEPRFVTIDDFVSFSSASKFELISDSLPCPLERDLDSLVPSSPSIALSNSSILAFLASDVRVPRILYILLQLSVSCVQDVV